MNALQEKLSGLTVAQLKACASGLFLRKDEGADEAFQAVLDELEKVMPEADYIEFLDNDLQSDWRESEGL